MGEYAYTVRIGGRATREQLAKLREIIASNEDITHMMASISAHIPTDEEVTQWKGFILEVQRTSTDDLIDVLDYCRENDLSYRICGYSTYSDTDFVEYWNPGMESAESLDADEDHEPRVTRGHIAEALERLRRMGPVTADQIAEVFDDVLPSDEIPALEIIDDAA